MMIFVLLAENSGGGIRIGAKGKEAAVWARGGKGKPRYIDQDNLLAELTGYSSLLDEKEGEGKEHRVIN